MSELGFFTYSVRFFHDPVVLAAKREGGETDPGMCCDGAHLAGIATTTSFGADAAMVTAASNGSIASPVRTMM